MDCSLQGSSVHGIFQVRVLEWVAISFSKGSSQPWDPTRVSRITGRCFNIWASKEAHESHSVVSDSLWPHGLYSPWNSPGKNTGVSSLFLLQRIFPTQGLNQGLLHCRQILYQLSYQGSPYKIETCLFFQYWRIALAFLLSLPLKEDGKQLLDFDPTVFFS